MMDRKSRDFIYENVSVPIRGKIKSVVSKWGKLFSIGDEVSYIDYKGELSVPFKITDFDLDWWAYPDRIRAWGKSSDSEHLVAMCDVDQISINQR